MSILSDVRKLRAVVLRELQNLDPEFKPYDVIRTDEGNLGMVLESEESPGTTPVVYYIEDGEIKGPSFGYVCTKVPPSEYER